jgi:predicted  nucleic acid-binding Zn-ribbon protein
MSRPFKLFRLQQLDSQIDWMGSRLEEINTALQDSEKLRRAEGRVEKQESELGTARKALRSAEENVRMQRLKIEQSEATLYGGKVRNPKELQDLQNEVASLKRYLEVLEDRQLEAMLVEEEAASKLLLAEQQLDQVKSATAQQHGELNRERDGLLKDLEHHMQERIAAVGSIESRDLAVYKKLREKRRGIAVAKVTDRACSACGSTLSTALLHAARSPNQITQCDSCARILYTG